jgi:predicted metal-dependent phosphotriesterase family hydrolase
VDRREFLRLSGLGSLGLPGVRNAPARVPSAKGEVITVSGPILPGRLGSTLAHEHVLVDFIGADKISRRRYNADEVYEVVLPFLQKAHESGCRGFVECTPAYLGRDPRLLQRLSEATGLHILTNTGYYGAAKDQYVPRHADDETADQLADRWVKEWTDGIEGTGIRPGFIKTGVEAGPLSPLDRKLIQAAARTHARTGLTIASHTGDTRAAMDQLRVLAEEQIGPDAIIWVHAQNDWDLESRAAAGGTGVWIEIDNVSEKTVPECVSRVGALKERGLLNRLLVSHDAGWYTPGEPRGGSVRGFETVYTAFVPALRKAGWTPAEIDQLLVRNPAAAFTVRIRRRSAANQAEPGARTMARRSTN